MSGKKQVAIKNSVPTQMVRIDLKNLSAIKVFNKQAMFLNTAIHTILVEPIIKKLPDNASEEVENHIIKLFDDFTKEANDELARMEVVISESGLEPIETTYSSPLEEEFECKTPLMGRFLNLINLTDKVLRKNDEIWFTGISNTRTCKNNQYAWEKKLTRVAGSVRILFKDIQGRIQVKKAQIDDKNKAIEKAKASAAKSKAEDKEKKSTLGSEQEPVEEKPKTVTKTDVTAKKPAKSKAAA